MKKNSIKNQDKSVKINQMKQGILIGILCLFVGPFLQAQDTLQTERLIIIKPYSPTVSDAFKLKQMPKVDPALTDTKKQLEYRVVSVPVASTFVPEKGKAATVTTQEAEALYDSYARLGFGNFTRLLGDLYTGFQVGENQHIGLYVNHHSSQGGGNKAFLEDKYYNTRLGFDFSADDTYYNWGIQAKGIHQMYNWYGVQNPLVVQIDPTHTFYGVSLGGDITYFEGLFDRAELKYRHFADDFGSGENYLYFSPQFGVPVGEQIISLDLSAEYLKGSFDKGYKNNVGINYGFFNVAAHPSIAIHAGTFNMDLGAEFVYAQDLELKTNDFKIYPKIKASLRVAGGYFIPYLGVDGGLQQHSYYAFAQENPFVSPTLSIAPTSTVYDAFIGIKGKFTEEVNYNFNVHYCQDDHAAFYASHPMNGAARTESYEYRNSFGVLYDDLNTLALKAEIGVNVSDNVQLGLDAAFYSYDAETQPEAWNRPSFELALNANYQIEEKWVLGADIFFVGDRQERSLLIVDTPYSETLTSHTLDSYFDLNLNIEYRFTEQLSVFVHGNNLLGENYQKWSNYPVLGTQILGGLSYRFNW